MVRKIGFTVAIIVVSFFAAQIVNHAIIGRLVIGDECAYDTGDEQTGKIFNLFYTISSNTGYHPEPSLFNFFFTAAIGILAGILLSYIFIWKQNNRPVSW